MKKGILNKIIVFTLCSIVISCTVVNAKPVKVNKIQRCSAVYAVDPHPWDETGSRN